MCSWQLLLLIDVGVAALGFFIPLFLWIALVLLIIWMIVFIRARPWRGSRGG
jgi:hypothetical protein